MTRTALAWYSDRFWLILVLTINVILITLALNPVMTADAIEDISYRTCVATSDNSGMFNPCLALDTTQVEDHRGDPAPVLLRVAFTGTDESGELLDCLFNDGYSGRDGDVAEVIWAPEYAIEACGGHV